MRPRLVIFVKEPRPGRVKTRLGAGIGMTGSAQWFRRQSAALIREMARDPRWQTVLAVSPDAAGLASRVWPAHLPRMPQGQGDLGERMARVFRSLPPGPVIVIGADIPGITRARIARGFRALGPYEAVFGPAEDGGYWLVGLKRSRPVSCGFMRGVRWSTGHALADTRATVPPGWRIAEVDRLRDVDTVDDLRALESGVR